MPILELYCNKTIQNLTRFTNAITMLEYCFREFDSDNEFIHKHQGQTPKNSADFVDRVSSLMENVNDVYKLDFTDIEIVLKNKRCKDLLCSL